MAVTAMNDTATNGAPDRVLRTEGFAAQCGSTECLASLRYFVGTRNFAAGLADLLGGPLPGALQALSYGAPSHGTPGSMADIVLAWRSHTETLLICSASQLAAIESFAAFRNDLCVVDQTGGIRVWTLTGPRVADVLARLGSPSLIPAPGTASTGRLAELSVLACRVRAEETLLIVDRVYEQHLMGWMRETVADFRDP